MNTDRQLRNRLLTELDLDPSIDSSRIGIEVDDGIVVVTGRLESWADRDAVRGTVCKAPGVRDVVDLTVLAR